MLLRFIALRQNFRRADFFVGLNFGHFFENSFIILILNTQYVTIIDWVHLPFQTNFRFYTPLNYQKNLEIETEHPSGIGHSKLFLKSYSCVSYKSFFCSKKFKSNIFLTDEKTIFKIIFIWKSRLFLNPVKYFLDLGLIFCRCEFYIRNNILHFWKP